MLLDSYIPNNNINASLNGVLYCNFKSVVETQWPTYKNRVKSSFAITQGVDFVRS